MPYRKGKLTQPLIAEESRGLYNSDVDVVQKETAVMPLPAMPQLGATHEPLRFSQLRANLFQIADAALASGEPVPLERNGQRLWLVPERRESRIDRLPVLDIVVGNADDLVNLNVGEWNETRNLG
jgi:hypothetical protein